MRSKCPKIIEGIEAVCVTLGSRERRMNKVNQLIKGYQNLAHYLSNITQELAVKAEHKLYRCFLL